MLTCFNTWSTLSGGVDVPGFTPIPGACGECCWDIDVWEFGPELPPMPLPAGDKALVVDGIPPAADFDRSYNRRIFWNESLRYSLL